MGASRATLVPVIRRRPNHLVDVTTPEAARRSIERNVHDPAATADTLVSAANMAILQGHPSLAREGFERALRIARESKDAEQVMLAQLGLGTALHALREYGEASRLFHQTIGATDQHPNTAVRGFALAWLADCQASLGDREAAAESLASAAACADVIGNEDLSRITEAIRQKLSR